MKTILKFSLAIISLAILIAANTAQPEKNTADYTVHEWGTFTSVFSSDGQVLDGLYLEEEALPSFVHEFKPVNGQNNLSMKGPNFNLSLPIKGVNIKMETPVIYFYSDKEMSVDVNVKFQGGIINQWYPAALQKRDKSLDLKSATVSKFTDIDFTKNYTDSIDWKVKILSPDSYLPLTSRQNLETPTWVNPRFTDANMLQIGNEREKFIFYRGLARFNQPFKVTAQSKEQITLENLASDDIGFALVYEYTKDQKARVWWTGELKGNSKQIVKKGEVETEKAIYFEFQQALEKAGLYKKEAASMLETWRHSYFEKEGLRVFWIVPRKFTDEILPLELSPKPKSLERVLVGRSEVMTPEFEQELAEKFVTNNQPFPFWYSIDRNAVAKDRFFVAWQQRAKQLIAKQKHQFSFLRQLGQKDLPYGEYYVSKDDKTGVSIVMHISGSVILSYKPGTGNEASDEVEYYFSSPEFEKKMIEVQSYYYATDRKAVFKVQDGKIVGDAVVYDINAKETKIVEKITPNALLN